MLATEMTPTHPYAPYDRLSPMRCGFELDGRVCTGRSSDIDWGAPGIHRFRCPKCRTMNLVRIVEATRS